MSFPKLGQTLSDLNPGYLSILDLGLSPYTADLPPKEQAPGLERWYLTLHAEVGLLPPRPARPSQRAVALPSSENAKG